MIHRYSHCSSYFLRNILLQMLILNRLINHKFSLVSYSLCLCLFRKSLFFGCGVTFLTVFSYKLWENRKFVDEVLKLVGINWSEKKMSEKR